MRRVPSLMDYISNLNQNPVENLIQLTLDQAKARGQPIKELEREPQRVKDGVSRVRRLAESRPLPPTVPPSPLRFIFVAYLGAGKPNSYFRKLIYMAYLLGSASPKPNSIKGLKRVAEALKSRKKGWEEPVEEAMLAFKAAGPNFPEDKDIIKMVHGEMDRLGIEANGRR